MLEKLKQILSDQLGVEPEEIQENSNFIEDLGADSLDVFQLLMAFEEHFDIEIPDSDAERLKTVGDALKYIEEKINQ